MENFQDIVSPFSSFLSPLLTRKRSNSLFDLPTKLPQLSVQGFFNKLDLEFSNEKNPAFEKNIHVYEQLAPTKCSYRSEFSFMDAPSTSDSSKSQFDSKLAGVTKVNKKIKKSKFSARKKLNFSNNLLQKLNVLKSKNRFKKQQQESEELETFFPRSQRKLSRAQTVKAKISTFGSNLKNEELKLKFLVKLNYDEGPSFKDLTELPRKSPGNASFEVPGELSSFPFNLEQLIEQEQLKKQVYTLEEVNPKNRKKKKSRRRKKTKLHQNRFQKIEQRNFCSFKRSLIARKKSHSLNIRSNILISRLTDNLSEMRFISNEDTGDTDC